MNFYGFDFANSPYYSRLFSPNILRAAQSAYTQGMGQFKPFNQSELEKIQAERAALLAAQNTEKPVSNRFIGPDGRIYSGNKESILQSYYKNMSGPDIGGLRAKKAARSMSNMRRKGLGLQDFGFEEM